MFLFHILISMLQHTQINCLKKYKAYKYIVHGFRIIVKRFYAIRQKNIILLSLVSLTKIHIFLQIFTNLDVFVCFVLKISIFFIPCYTLLTNKIVI